MPAWVFVSSCLLFCLLRLKYLWPCHPCSFDPPQRHTCPRFTLLFPSALSKAQRVISRYLSARCVCRAFSETIPTCLAQTLCVCVRVKLALRLLQSITFSALSFSGYPCIPTCLLLPAACAVGASPKWRCGPSRPASFANAPSLAIAASLDWPLCGLRYASPSHVSPVRHHWPHSPALPDGPPSVASPPPTPAPHSPVLFCFRGVGMPLWNFSRISPEFNNCKKL